MRTTVKILFVLIMLTLLGIQPASAEKHNFRNTYWGMSPAQVEEVETAPLGVKKEHYLAYGTNVLGKSVFALYVFLDNKLFVGKYMLRDKHTNDNDYIADYEDFKKVLTAKYGKPSVDKKIWKDDLHKDNYQDWGMAIGFGDLVYVSKWETEDTIIEASLSGENLKIDCEVTYKSKKLSQMAKQAREKKSQDDF